MLDGHTGSAPGAKSSFPWLDFSADNGANSGSDNTVSRNVTDESSNEVSLFDSIMEQMKKVSAPDLSLDDDFEIEEIAQDNRTPPQPPEIVSILQYIPVERIASLNESQIRSLDPREFSTLSADKLQALRPAQLAWLSTAQLQALRVNDFRPEQIASLAPAQVKSFSPSQIAQLEPAKFQSMTTQQLEALTAEQLSRVDPKSLEALRSEQLHAAVHDRQSALTTEQLTGLSRDQMEAVTKDLLVGRLTITENKNLSSET